VSTVTLVEHQQAWPDQFRAVALELEQVFAGCGAVVEHVGSTAIAGLVAKPVLDVLVGARTLAEVQERVAALGERGYRYRPEYETLIAQRRYFVREAGALPRVHLHAVVFGQRLWNDHLAFRDALRRDAALAARYAALKRELAVRHARDKAAYTEAKAPFIARVLADARSTEPCAGDAH
jgi:GrpB-like predicted nucleotidyltransferase (UPF0157 family)